MSASLSLTVECTPRLRPTSEYAALLEALRKEGFEVDDRTPLEQRDASFVAAVVVIYLGRRVADTAVDRIVAAVIAWGERQLRSFMRRRNATGRVVVPIYGPDGELLREVEVPESHSAAGGASDSPSS